MEKELLSPYQSLIKTIHFPNSKAVENIDVATILKRYPNLEVLDLTYCFQVSSTSFLNGHKTLKYLIANGTSISVILNPKKFQTLFTTKSVF
ncbi:hypothetical protein BN1013_02239 [Candidatus Rubidus massiliensis]|nr:hypothetical protein BN1013_02239 [Candidatus Rubidus massiliensis]